METYSLEKEIKVFGIHVKTFPLGIADAFDELMELFDSTEHTRYYYGLSTCESNGTIRYYATAEERFAGEAPKGKYETFTIEQGDYLMETVKDWLQKTECIKDVFAELLKDDRIDRSSPCIEWYKNDEEMCCLVKLQEANVNPK